MKKIIALLLVLVMALSLVACGDNGGAKETTAPAAQVTELTIKVWTPAEDQAEGNNWLAKMEENFAAAHPEYVITWVNETQSEGDAAGLINGDVTASADVYMFANDQMGSLITSGGLSQLGGQFLEQVKNDNNDFMVNSVTHSDGGVYAFPVTSNTWFMYYNKDVFTEEDVKSLDTMLTKGKVCIPFNVGWNAGCFFLGTGGTVFGEAGNDATAGIQFGGENGYTAAKKMIELVGNENVIAGGMDDGKLIDGSADAIFSGSWVAASLKAALGDKLGVAMLPKFTVDGNEYQMTALSGSKCVGVNPNSSSVAGKQVACTLFAAYLASEEAQLARYEMRGVIPAHKGLAENEVIKNDPIAVAEINTITYASVVQSALPEMGNYWTPVETFSKNVVAGDINADNYQEQVDKMMEQLNGSGL